MSRYALISVSDKTAVEFFAQELLKYDFQIISTGGTAQYLQTMGVPTLAISDWTGFPEIMDGRVKTLHPMVHGGILAQRDNPHHLEVMTELGIKPIDIVVVNLYPFVKTLQKSDVTEEEIIENIDIGGPSMVRSAAKNFSHVTILTSPVDYFAVLAQLQLQGNTLLELRRHLAAKAFEHCAIYDAAISNYFKTIDTHREGEPDTPNDLLIGVSKKQELRYGENPHQPAGFYSQSEQGWLVLHGKELSYNNMLDLDAALKAINLFEKPTVIILKHTNPCGIGSDYDLVKAYDKAFNSDTQSPFGGIVITNRPLEIELARRINEVFTEIIIAPSYTSEAVTFLEKKKDRRLIQYSIYDLLRNRPDLEIRSIYTGYLLQKWDDSITTQAGWKVVTKKEPNPEQMEALRFAWHTVSILKSNAIALTGKDATYGLGTGQTSRVDSAEIAINRAIKYKHDLTNAVCASDGFFPFRDSIELMAKQGIKAIIQPGGSKGDPDVIAACDELGISMVFTGSRHFRH
jgi:phosphoribosylaminoimidazolecarboxamide formyltransferase/IMP cyclohydrolase